MKYDTIKDAACAWVQTFNAFSQDMIERFIEGDHISEWYELTKPTAGDRVYVFDENASGEIDRITEDGDYIIELDNGGTIIRDADDFEVDRDGCLPMWGTMWQFGDRIDDDWLSGEFGEDGLQLMSDCGFRIFEHSEFGYFFGIDGAGYDFYEAHWIPLYKARGLHWHKEETEAA